MEPNSKQELETSDSIFYCSSLHVPAEERGGLLGQKEH